MVCSSTRAINEPLESLPSRSLLFIFSCRVSLHSLASMAIKSSHHGFRVIIAGGGLAGLTLANALERAGIDYILLEARDEIAPHVGASLGIFPNGSRILDQLGCYDNIAELTYGIKWAGNHKVTGELIQPKSDGPQLGFRRSVSTFLSRTSQTSLRHGICY